MKLRFTKHAEEKLRVRNIDHEKVMEILNSPQHVFYDTLRSTEVAVGEITLKGKASTLVIIYAKQDNAYLGPYAIYALEPSHSLLEAELVAELPDHHAMPSTELKWDHAVELE